MTDKYGFRPEWATEEDAIIHELLFGALVKLFIIVLVFVMGLACLILGVDFISQLRL